MKKNILAPTDFSEKSVRAVRYALELANETGGTVHILYVYKDELDSSEIQECLKQIGSYSDSYVDVATVDRVMMGNPAEAIVAYARRNKIDLITMGTHGRSGLSHLVLGSVAESVLREAPCPVTVFGPHDGENSTINHAVEVLEEMIGEGWEMEKEMGRTLMSGRLIESLRVSSPTALRMVKELESFGWIVWNEGSWTMVEGRELIES